MLLQPFLNTLHQPISSRVRPYWPITVLNRNSIILVKRVEAAVQNELQQFHDRRDIDPKETQDLSYEQQMKSLAYMMFLKLENDEVKIKGRGCKDGRKQWNWLSNEGKLSHTVSTKGLILSCIIDEM